MTLGQDRNLTSGGMMPPYPSSNSNYMRRDSSSYTRQTERPMMPASMATNTHAHYSTSSGDLGTTTYPPRHNTLPTTGQQAFGLSQPFTQSPTNPNSLVSKTGFKPPYPGLPSMDFAAFEAFVTHNPRILEGVDPEQLMDQARKAYASNELGIARAFVQQFVLFKYLQKIQQRDRSELFKRLKSDKSPQKIRFFQDFDRAYESITQYRDRTNNIAPASSSTAATASGTAQRQSSYTIDQNATTIDMGYSTVGGNNFGAHEFTANPPQRYSYAPPSNFIPPGAASMPGRIGAESEFQSPQFGMPTTFRDGSPATPGKNLPGHQSWRDPMRSGSEEDEAATDIVVSNNRIIRGIRNEDLSLTENVSTYSDITTDNQPFETLDQRYQIRKPGFYVKGCVFSLLFIENASQVHHPSSTLNPPGLFDGPRGQRAYASIRRMVVVKQRDNFCLCVSISTYGGRGLAKFKGRREIDAHAIIYMADETAQRLPQEANSTKQPIAVARERRAPSLDKASRVHFGKLYTIQYNCRTMHIGHVTQSCLPLLDKYVYQEMND